PRQQRGQSRDRRAVWLAGVEAGPSWEHRDRLLHAHARKCGRGRAGVQGGSSHNGDTLVTVSCTALHLSRRFGVHSWRGANKRTPAAVAEYRAPGDAACLADGTREPEAAFAAGAAL